MTDINPSLGSCGYWHLIEGAPEGPPEQSASQLLEMVRRHDDLPARSWPIPPVIVRAMAFELTITFAIQGSGLSRPLVELLAWSADLPDAFLSDPPAFFAGGWKGGRPTNDAKAKVTASWLERQHYQSSGNWMPLFRLEQRLQDMLGENEAPARSTLRKWRTEIDYSEWVTFDPNDNGYNSTGET